MTVKEIPITHRIYGELGLRRKPPASEAGFRDGHKTAGGMAGQRILENLKVASKTAAGTGGHAAGHKAPTMRISDFYCDSERYEGKFEDHGNRSKLVSVLCRIDGDGERHRVGPEKAAEVIREHKQTRGLVARILVNHSVTEHVESGEMKAVFSALADILGGTRGAKESEKQGVLGAFLEILRDSRFDSRRTPDEVAHIVKKAKDHHGRIDAGELAHALEDYRQIPRPKGVDL